MLSGGQILQSLALLAKVELVKQNITGDSEVVKRKFSFDDKVNKVSHDEYTRSNDTEPLYRKEHEIFADSSALRQTRMTSLRRLLRGEMTGSRDIREKIILWILRTEMF